MVYQLLIQKDGETRTVKLSMRDPYILRQHIAEHCRGYSLSEKEYKRLIKEKSMILEDENNRYKIGLT